MNGSLYKRKALTLMKMYVVDLSREMSEGAHSGCKFN